eukprot:CAMPEP_0116999424 /NCGR_PEP_ID=MMETSP0472-20121206/2129_1 /TAXON_ID=693140 ORGANISM="Tiarina fusus, Strain LIS" /NCGR_SAMPLE_ID=MMETSP0472 /ASSEMBLY_ACC=CAM_ASM_000603 /LENGTH=111 /DNA_ID=CAMNT_0004698829 /DNA_START=175 /DNA_END=510 /DNA_ORIENTATION=+
MVFVFFATTQSHATLLESSIGPCGYCHAKDSIDVVEQTNKTSWFGLFPAADQVERLASCKRCGKSIKEVHYNLRVKPPPTFAVNNNTVDGVTASVAVPENDTAPVAEGKQI